MKGRPEGPPFFRLSGALGHLSMPVFDRQENNIGRKHCSEIPRQLHEHSQCQRQHKTDPLWCRNGNIKLTPLTL